MNVGANRGPLGDGLLDKGRWLFHYTTAERAFEKILLTRRLRMSPYRAMRDPLENKDLHLTFAGRVGESDEDSADFERAAFEALGMIKTIRDAVRLLSFTVDTEKWETPWGSGWARPRMWEQYADNHAGVCLVFDKTDAIDTFRAQMNRIPGTTKVHRLEENVGAAEVEPTDDDLREIEDAQIEARGHRYGEASERMVDR